MADVVVEAARADGGGLVPEIPVLASGHVGASHEVASSVRSTASGLRVSVGAMGSRVTSSAQGQYVALRQDAGNGFVLGIGKQPLSPGKYGKQPLSPPLSLSSAGCSPSSFMPMGSPSCMKGDAPCATHSPTIAPRVAPFLNARPSHLSQASITIRTHPIDARISND